MSRITVISISFIDVLVFFFFFFKQKTAYEMRISDWSSDVCSSDLSSSGIAAGYIKRPSAMPRAFIRGRSGLPPPASSKAVLPRPHKDFPMKKKDLRDLLSRAAAVSEDPTSESAHDRETLVEDRTEVASQDERLELAQFGRRRRK